MRTLTLCIAALLLTTTHAQTPPVRDVRLPATGTAAVSGVVVTDEQEPRPIRRARVTARATQELPNGLTVVTDDRGAFSLTGLPAARYTLMFEKDGYPGLAYGAKRPGRAGTSLVLAEGQQITGLTMRMPRGSVITGTVLDQNGQPAVGASVRAMRYMFLNGNRRLTPAGSMGGIADDRGIYRIYGLAAGEYAVVASAARVSPFDTSATTITNAADVARARQDLKTPAAGAEAAPGVRAPANAAGPSRPAAVAYSPVYYPGTASPTQAAMVPVAAGEERTGIDFQLSLTPTARIEGTISIPDGVAPQSVAVSLVTLGDEVTLSPFEGMRVARLDSAGRFAFASVKPGRYVVSARGAAPDAKPSTTEAFALGALFGVTEISIDGNDISNVTVDLQPGGTVSGRLVFDTSSPESVPDVSRIRVTLNAVQAPGEVSFGASPGIVDKSGAFTITGASPGRYRVMPVSIPNPTKWVVKSSVLDGRDTLDVPVEIRPHQHVDGVVVTVTDRPAELTGMVQDAAGNAAADYFIIVFSGDRAFWTPQSRRIQGIRPGQDGKYTVRNLPAGEYILVAVADVEQGEWFDPSFLQRVTPSGMRLTIADGEKRVQDLQIK